MTVSSDITSLPHGLDLVVDFVNTFDVEAGTDELATPADLAAWLRARRLLGDSRVSVTQLQHGIEFREALRATMLAHNGAGDGHLPSATLEHVAERGRLSVRFGDDGSVALAARADGFAGALAQLLVPVASGVADGSWARVKACRAEDCHWAFYDRSRNRSGRWCDMAVCGNRTKVRHYRSKRD